MGRAVAAPFVRAPGARVIVRRLVERLTRHEPLRVAIGLLLGAAGAVRQLRAGASALVDEIWQAGAR